LAKDSVPALRQALEDKDGRVWSKAAVALVQINSGGQAALPILFNASRILIDR